MHQYGRSPTSEISSDSARATLGATHASPHVAAGAGGAVFAIAALTGFYDEIEAKRTELAQRRDAEIIQEGEAWPGDDLENGCNIYTRPGDSLENL